MMKTAFFLLADCLHRLIIFGEMAWQNALGFYAFLMTWRAVDFLCAGSGRFSDTELLVLRRALGGMLALCFLDLWLTVLISYRDGTREPRRRVWCTIKCLVYFSSGGIATGVCALDSYFALNGVVLHSACMLVLALWYGMILAMVLVEFTVDVERVVRPLCGQSTAGPAADSGYDNTTEEYDDYDYDDPPTEYDPPDVPTEVKERHPDQASLGSDCGIVTCVVCKANRTAALYTPCSCAVACWSCAVTQRLCPKCNKKVASVQYLRLG